MPRGFQVGVLADFGVNNLTIYQIQNRFEALGLSGLNCQYSQLSRYVELLSKWNKTVNLTSLDIDPLSNDAIDRLIVEPVLAASEVRTGSLHVVDIGSGGGSPAIPFRIQLPNSGIRLIESRSRKCAFLREVIRDIGLVESRVEEGRFEELAACDRLTGVADLITVRAVRFDQAFMDLAVHILRPSGVVFRFCSSEGELLPDSMELVRSRALVPGSTSFLQVIKFR